MTATLSFALQHRPGERDRTGYTSERWSADFLVDGKSLRTLLKVGDRSGIFLSRKDRVFGRTKRNAAARTMFEGIGESPVRLMLYICPECGDLGCGAYTCDARRIGDAIVWSRFGFESGIAEDPSDFDSFSDVGPFEFGVAQYLAAIEVAANGKF